MLRRLLLHIAHHAGIVRAGIHAECKHGWRCRSVRRRTSFDGAGVDAGQPFRLIRLFNQMMVEGIADQFGGGRKL